MLLLDDKPFQLTKEQRKKFTNFTVFTIPPSKIRWDLENNKWDIPNGEGIPVEYTAYMDPGDGGGKRQVRMKYWETSRPNPQMKDDKIYEPAFILIKKGYIELQEFQYELIYFLENHPNNGKNPDRGKNPMIFVTFDKPAILKQRAGNFMAKVKAMSYIMGDDEKDFNALKAVAREIENDTQNRLDHGIANSPGMTEEELRDALGKVAEKYPQELLRYLNTNATIIRVDIETFKEEGILEYKSGEAGNMKGKWVMKTGDEKQPEIEICSVLKGYEPTDTLVKMLRDDDKKNVYKKLQARLKKAVPAE